MLFVHMLLLTFYFVKYFLTSSALDKSLTDAPARLQLQATPAQQQPCSPPSPGLLPSQPATTSAQPSALPRSMSSASLGLQHLTTQQRCHFRRYAEPEQQRQHQRCQQARIVPSSLLSKLTRITTQTNKQRCSEPKQKCYNMLGNDCMLPTEQACMDKSSS